MLTQRELQEMVVRLDEMQSQIFSMKEILLSNIEYTSQDFDTAIRQTNRVLATKIYRHMHKVSLKEAIEAVNDRMREETDNMLYS